MGKLDVDVAKVLVGRGFSGFFPRILRYAVPFNAQSTTCTIPLEPELQALSVGKNPR